MATPLDRIRLRVQGRPDFSVGPKLQTIWGAREAFVFALEGIAAVTMTVCAARRWLPGMIGAELAMIAAVGLLFSHLGNPKAAWRAIANVRRSWISRGTAVIGAFCGLGALAILIELVRPAMPVPPWITDLVFWLLAICAGFIIFYPGFAMRASTGIPLWQTSFLPILSALGGLSTGGAVVVAAAPALGVDVGALVGAELAVLAALAVAIAGFIARALGKGRAAQLSARLMMKERRWFWGLAVATGLVIPVLALLLAPASTAVLTIAAVSRYLGDAALRYAILKTGMYEAVV